MNYNLKLQQIQKCPHCKNETLKATSWYVSVESGKCILGFQCSYHICREKYYRITDKIIKELILEKNVDY